MKIIHWAIMFAILMVFVGPLQANPTEEINNKNIIFQGADAPQTSIENAVLPFEGDYNISYTIVVSIDGVAVLKMPQVRPLNYNLFAPDGYAGYWDVRLNANKNKFII